MPGIVVGIDGSEHSHRVLAWAVREAALRQTPLTVLTVHQVVASHWTGNPVVYPEDRPEEAKARQAAEEAVNQVITEAGDSRPASVTVRATSGLPATELIEASKDAELVVVGSRGGGGFVGLLVGSVSDQVTKHAACPVVVIR